MINGIKPYGFGLFSMGSLSRYSVNVVSVHSSVSCADFFVIALP
jgi:hypothetical protein